MDLISKLEVPVTYRQTFSQLTGLSCIALASVALLGCSVAGHRSTPLPQDGPTMVEIYRQHMQSEGNESSMAVRERLPLRDAVERSPGDFKYTAMSKIENRFPRLHNPDLVMYVLPHLSKGRYPIPGYVTVFPMYETVEYAMPGEMLARRMPVKEKTAVGEQTDAKGKGISVTETSKNVVLKKN